MKMKPIYLLLLLSLSICSCRSSRSMQMEIQTMRTSLYYELTSLEYFGEKKQDVYLDFIPKSNIDYYTTTKRKGGYIIPLIVYNVQATRYMIRLGEGSLTQTYRAFLTDALLTECNSSSCFNLIDNQEEIAPDSTYRLNINIVHNETGSKVILSTHTMIWFDGETLEMFHNKVDNAWTNLAIKATLTKNNEVLFEKTYQLDHRERALDIKYEDSVMSNEACLDLMARSLSLATKQVVENISTELGMLITPFK